MPPLMAYRSKPVGVEKVNVQGDDNARKVYYGWNNVTDYERKGIENVVQWLRKEKKCEVPANFSDRNLLKFVQANFFNIEKAGNKLFNHFNWLDSLPREPRLTERTIKLLQGGVFYIHGRDKFYRPCLVMDGAAMVKLMASEAGLLTNETFTEEFVFLF